MRKAERELPFIVFQALNNGGCIKTENKKILQTQNQTQTASWEALPLERCQKNINRDKEPIICYLQFYNRYTAESPLVIMQFLSSSHFYSL
jgi:hypothetical protein